ncbi:RRT14 [Candida theae]|uniref:Regulator of rDNA transcription 14 n=1 Tax=Candida theae TaxID=1198502 RepID=A0AAD5G192_9ASCO|nr:RRT14 [Candida theae]KAI5968448.1 RRT14 [Candida theae]
MAFTSKASQHQAEQTVNKLFADILHTQPTTSTSTNNKDDAKLSSTQILTNQLHRGPKSTRANPKSQSKNKRSTLQKKNKKRESQDKKFEKFIKYNHILSKPASQQTESDKAYLRKLVRKNTNQIKNLSHIDDFEVESELQSVKLQLLNDLQPTLSSSKRRLRKKLLVPNKKSEHGEGDGDAVTKQEYIDFDDKVKRGLISMPGLTPGLAPVDYNESESEPDT